MPYESRYSTGQQSMQTRPRPQVAGTVNPRADVLKDLRQKERRRYSTMQSAASIAALDKVQ